LAVVTQYTRELSVYDGQACLGRIKINDDGKAVAFDKRGKRLGRFPSVEAASAAFNASEVTS
jgi:hypothetical protein